MSDLISRKDAIDALMLAVREVGILDAEDIETVFNLLPTAELPIKDKCAFCPHCTNCDVNEDGIIYRKKGEWIDHYCDEDGRKDGIECSCCHKWWYMHGNPPNFCLNCGADMRKGGGAK